MNPSGEEERRFMGFPVSRLPRWLSGQDWPHGDGEGGASHFAWLWHPIAWVRWRIELRRRGPYAADFEEFRQGPQPDTE